MPVRRVVDAQRNIVATRRAKFVLLTDRRKAILRAIYKLGGGNKTRLSFEVGMSANGLDNHIAPLEAGGYIERDPLRLTHAGIEVAKGYRDD